MKRFLGIFILLFFLFGSGNLTGQTPDGYILIGTTDSYTTGYGMSLPDMLVYRLDTAGNVVWFNNYGGVFPDEGITCTQTADGGYAVAGSSWSYSWPYHHFILKKLDTAGGESWTRDYGGTTRVAECRSLRQTADGGYIIGGDSYPYGAFPSDFDILIYKTDAAGNEQWHKSFGSLGGEWLSTAIQTADGGYLLVGHNDTYTHGGLDFLVYKLNANGKKQWRKNYGGALDDAASWWWTEPVGRQAVQTTDGGYVFCGLSWSYFHGTWGPDMLVYKVDASGNKEWRKNFGGVSLDYSMAIEQTADGGYILAGTSLSYINWGTGSDFLVYKLSATGKKQWRKNFGGATNDKCLSVQQTADEGYILAGYTMSYVTGPYGDWDLLVYKLNAAGKKQWRKHYGGVNEERGGDIRETSH